MNTQKVPILNKYAYGLPDPTKELIAGHCSGGSTKGYGTVGVFKGLRDSGIKFDLISGVSIGALTSVAIAMEKYDEIQAVFMSGESLKPRKFVPSLFKKKREEEKNLLERIWSISPVKEDGSINLKKAGFVLLRDKTAIGDIRRIKKVVSSVISYADFKEYQSNPKYPVCLILAVDFGDGAKKLFNLKDPSISYRQFLDIILASSSIPIFNNYVEMMEGDKKMYLYDGGTRDHIASHFVLQESGLNFKSMVNVFTRPEEYSIESGWVPKDIVNVLLRTIEFLNIEVSKGDEARVKHYWKDVLGKDPQDNHMVYLPSIMQSLYDVDRTRLKKLFEIGYALGKKLGEILQKRLSIL